MCWNIKFLLKVTAVYQFCHFSVDVSHLLSLLAASEVELTPRFGFICSQISQLLRLITQAYGKERTCDK